MDLSMLLQGQNQLCPSSYEIVDISGPVHALYFGWNEIMIHETCSNQLHSSWNQIAVVTWERNEFYKNAKYEQTKAL